jgi:hypothetical protein
MFCSADPGHSPGFLSAARGSAAWPLGHPQILQSRPPYKELVKVTGHGQDPSPAQQRIQHTQPCGNAVYWDWPCLAAVVPPHIPVQSMPDPRRSPGRLADWTSPVFCAVTSRFQWTTRTRIRRLLLISSCSKCLPSTLPRRLVCCSTLAVQGWKPV